MSTIEPPGWKSSTVRELGDVQLGRQRSPSSAIGPHQTPYLRVANVHDGFIDYSDVLTMSFSALERRTFSVQPGDVLLNEGQSLELVGRSAVYNGGPDRYCIQNTLVRFRCGETLVPSFAQAIFKQWMDTGKFAQIAKQTTSIAHLGAGRFAELTMAFPPVAEQRRIAEILGSLHEVIRKTEQVIAKLQKMKQGLLHDLLTRGINESGELRDPERHPVQFKDSPLGRIPREWLVRPLVEIAEVRSGIAKNSNRAVANPVWVNYLRVANVQDGFLDLSEMSKIQIGKDEVQQYAVLDGDVLMNEGGDLDKLGRGAVWRGQFAPCVHQNHVFAVRCGTSLLPDFLDAWTGSVSARRYFMVAGKRTTNLASINKTALGLLPVAVPPLQEQTAVACALLRHETRVELEKATLKKLRGMKRGLMSDLLTGKVRIPVSEGIAQ